MLQTYHTVSQYHFRYISYVCLYLTLNSAGSICQLPFSNAQILKSTSRNYFRSIFFRASKNIFRFIPPLSVCVVVLAFTTPQPSMPPVGSPIM